MIWVRTFSSKSLIKRMSSVIRKGGLYVQNILIRKLIKREIKEKESEFTEIFSKIMLEAIGDPGDLAQSILNTADILCIAIVNGQIVGFATGKFFDKNILYLQATIVHKDFSGLGLYKKLNNKVILYYLSRFPKRAFTGFWLVFRTQNPSLYERVYKLTPLFPDYKSNRKPKSDELEVFKKVCLFISPNNEVNNEDFTIWQAYKDNPGIILNPKDIPFAYDPLINDFFENKLHLSKMDGNAMICMGKIKFALIVKHFTKKA